jgi:hypothetical protein
LGGAILLHYSSWQVVLSSRKGGKYDPIEKQFTGDVAAYFSADLAFCNSPLDTIQKIGVVLSQITLI